MTAAVAGRAGAAGPARPAAVVAEWWSRSCHGCDRRGGDRRREVQIIADAEDTRTAAGARDESSSVPAVDEGLPIAYKVLDDGVAVYASGGEEVGTVDHVIADGSEDIFHGIVMRTQAGKHFIGAEDVASLHERGVDLLIDAAAAAALPEAHGAAPMWRVDEPGVKPSGWSHLLGRFGGGGGTSRPWNKDR